MLTTESKFYVNPFFSGVTLEEEFKSTYMSLLLKN